MLESMTSQQVIEWEAMLERWQIGDHPNYRADVRNSMLMALTANIHRQKGKAAKPDDFMPKFEQKSGEAAPQSPDALRDRMLSLAERRNKQRPRRDRVKPGTAATA
jgi:hypothetical protein